MNVVFDIDGTVADISHRLHWISSSPKNWKAFYTGMENDLIIQSVASLAQMCYLQGHKVIFCTGRNDDYREKTKNWLDQHNLRHHDLYMRGSRDHRKDFEVKKELILEIINKYGSVDLVFEDRTQNVSMFRNLGLTCLQVSDGNY